MQGIRGKIKLFIILVSTALFITSCTTTPDLYNPDFRQEMRDFVIRISDTARTSNSTFIVIPQNGQELISLTDEVDGTLAADYIAAIDGTGREDLFYGYSGDNIATPQAENEYMMGYLEIFKTEGIEVLTIDYCSTESYILDSYTVNNGNGFISFAADQRNLNNIPAYPATPYNINTDNIQNISQAKNFLYLINSENYSTRQDFITDVSATNYDVIIMDLFHNEDAYTSSQIDELKVKQNGSNRLVICYMSIGEAEDYRFYWNPVGETGDPIWLDQENPDWKGNFKVRYWEKEWQDIILSGDDSYLGKILAAGFDGVYLDIIDGFEYFENY
ncbi:MAG: endo alpha-1,4 polygalactosaminidase [Spirochaetales bacterium]|nr:endo alpha-1,4 polygalactosaminidase [Spirochaetales bacterium]